MAVVFDHTILPARDSEASAKFLAEMLGLPAPRHWRPFQIVTTENGTNLDYMHTDGKITPQHYAFLVSESEFDEILGRIRERNLPYWADPGQTQRGISMITTVAAALISRIRTVICSKSSPVRTAAVDGTRDRSVTQPGGGRSPHRVFICRCLFLGKHVSRNQH